MTNNYLSIQRMVAMAVLFLAGNCFAQDSVSNRKEEKRPSGPPGEQAEPAKTRRPGGPPPIGSRPDFILKLLNSPEVRQEINLTEEQQELLREHGERLEVDLATLLKQRINQSVDEILTPPQLTRLTQISTQLLGPEALLDVAIAEKLKLTKQQIEKLKTIQLDTQLEIENLKHLFKGKEGEVYRMVAEEDLRANLHSNMRSILTAAQRAEFQKMRGSEFDTQNLALPGPKGKGLPPHADKGKEN